MAKLQARRRHGPRSVAAAALINVDFSALSPGKMTAANFLTNTGMTFTRATVSTVQKSASTVEGSAADDDALMELCDGC